MSTSYTTEFTVVEKAHPTIKLFKCIEIPATDNFLGGTVEHTKVIYTVVVWVYWLTDAGRYATLTCNESRDAGRAAIDIEQLQPTKRLRDAVPVPMYRAVCSLYNAHKMGLL